MDSEPEPDEEWIYHAVAAKPAGERSAYLAGLCKGDTALQARVEALLESRDETGDFLEVPVFDLGEQASTRRPLERPGTLIGRYKLLERIGEGGFGAVWAAEQREPIRRRVALKIIKLGMDTKQVIARFEAERQALALMDHPGIAKVLDAGATESGRPYFVMELVRGVPITDYCDQERLATRERLELFISVCHAIQHAHQKGVIHRDIKPSNIMVTLHDGVPVPKVIDFGIAKATQRELTEKTVYTEFQQFIGTPAYVSPEQAEMSGLDLDTRSDIYSLGVLLYELLTGATPFDTQELTRAGLEEMRKIITGRAPLKPSTRLRRMQAAGQNGKSSGSLPRPAHRGIDRDLDWIVMKCLEKDRARRYETANGLAMDITRHLTNEPVMARPPSKFYEFQKTVRRHKVGFMATVAIIAALTAGIMLSTWQAIRATQAQAAAVKAKSDELEQKLIAQEQQKAAEAQKQRAEESEAYAQRLLYGANMNLVQAAFEQDNFLNARRLLDDTAAYPDRGFEWYYWQRKMHPEVLTFRGHTSPVSAVAFSPDGRWVVSCEAPDESFSVVKMWDRATGVERYTFRTEGEIDRLAFSPDGSQFLINNRDARWRGGPHSRLLVFSTETGGPLAAYPDLRDGSYSPDGRQIAGVTDDTVFLVDASGKSPPSPFVDLKGYEPPSLEARSSDVEPLLLKPSFAWCRFSPDGQSLITGIPLVRIGPGSTDQIIVWDSVTGKQKGRAFFNDSFHWQSRIVSPDSRQLATTDWNNLAIKRVATGEVVGSFGFRGELRSLAYSPDGQYLFGGSRDLTARVIDVASQQEVRRLPGHTRPIDAVAWSPDGRWLATGDEGGVVRIWDAAAKPKPLSTQGWSGAALSPDGSRIALALKEADGWKLALLSATTGERIRTVAPKILMTLKNVRGGRFSFSADGGQVVVAIWHAPTAGAKTDEPEGYLIVRWNLETDELLEFPFPDRAAVGPIRFSPDGHHIIVTSGHSATIWNAETGKLERTLDHGTAGVTDAIYSPDGTRIFTVARAPQSSPSREEDGIRMWDAVSGRELARFPAEVQEQGDACVSPDGQRFAVPVEGNQVKVFDLSTNRAPLTLSGHQQRILSVAFSPDGRRLLTASQDRTARLWDAETGRELLTLKGHSGTVNGVAFFPDGRRILTTSWDGTFRIWEAATDQEVEAWAREEKAQADAVQARFDEQENAAALRAKDPLAIKQWLVLAPIPYNGTDGAAALDREQIPHEAGLFPRVDQHATVANVDLTWMAVKQDDYRIGFRRLLRFPAGDTNYSVAYAVTYIRTDTARTNLLLKVGSDDQAKIYLNGEQVYRSVEPRSWRADQDTVPNIGLRAGLNVLVFKVVNQRVDWAGSVWITEADGNPVPGVSVTLDPDGNQ
jgi:WD40 repeat protein/serine/threonine protein kinase